MSPFLTKPPRALRLKNSYICLLINKERLDIYFVNHRAQLTKDMFISILYALIKYSEMPDSLLNWNFPWVTEQLAEHDSV